MIWDSPSARLAHIDTNMAKSIVNVDENYDDDDDDDDDANANANDNAHANAANANDYGHVVAMWARRG